MNLINRTQANLFIQTVRGKMIASVLHLDSLHLSSSRLFSSVCPCYTLILGRCMCACVYKHGQSIRYLLDIHPGEFPVSPSFLSLHWSISSLLLSFFYALVTTSQGGDAGLAARTFGQDGVAGQAWQCILLLCRHFVWLLSLCHHREPKMFLRSILFSVDHDALWTDLLP